MENKRYFIKIRNCLLHVFTDRATLSLLMSELWHLGNLEYPVAKSFSRCKSALIVKTSVHSIKMCTARLLTVSYSIRKGGVCLGGYLPGVVYPSMQWGRHPSCEQNRRQV